MKKKNLYHSTSVIILIISLTVLTIISSFSAISLENEDDYLLEIFREKGKYLSENIFIQNDGQLEPDEINYYSGGGDIYFTSNSLLYRSREVEQCKKDDYGPDFLINPCFNTNRYRHEWGVVIKYSFIGSNNIVPKGIEQCTWNTNFFKGNDPESCIRISQLIKKLNIRICGTI